MKRIIAILLIISVAFAFTCCDKRIRIVVEDVDDTTTFINTSTSTKGTHTQTQTEIEKVITTKENLTTTEPTEKQVSKSEIQSRLRIFETDVYEVDSAGGVSAIVYWRNESPKTIKYINFYLTPYNAVGDAVKCEIRGYSRNRCYHTGPVEQTYCGEYAYVEMNEFQFENGERIVVPTGNYKWRYIAPGYREDIPQVDVGVLENKVLSEAEIKKTALGTIWERTWYNNNIDSIKVEGITIEYMDGEIFEIPASQCHYAFW